MLGPGESVIHKAIKVNTYSHQSGHIEPSKYTHKAIESKPNKHGCPSGPRGYVKAVMCSHSRVRVPLRAFFFSSNEAPPFHRLFHNCSLRSTHVWEGARLNDRFRMDWIPIMVRFLDERASYCLRVWLTLSC